VIAPKLQLTKALPAEALMCDTIPVRLTVTNSGSGSARNVKVSDPLPAGLTTLDGKNVVEFEVPVLPAGQSKEATFQVKAAKTGTYANRATAVASGGLSSEASASVIVRQPVLTISKRATDKQYAGRNIAYELVVANKGDVTAQNVLVADRIPAGTALISTSDGGVANSNGVIEWRVGSLAPDAAKKVSFVVRAVQKGTITNTAEAVATCAAPVRDQTVSEVVGIPAILLEVVDIDDPIEVGKTETYVITVTNQGSETDTNIAIACTLEDSQSYVSSDGPTAATATGQVIRFAPLPALAAKAKATWKVVIRAEKAGDVRFTTVMSSAQLQRPVQETESTNQY
jgi:uncharacterized repeat protein (TIGR01451 family)